MPDRGEPIIAEGLTVRDIKPIPIDCEHIPGLGNEIFKFVMPQFVKVLGDITNFEIGRGLVLRESCIGMSEIFKGILSQVIQLCETLGIPGNLNQGLIRIRNDNPGADYKDYLFLPIIADRTTIHGMIVIYGERQITMVYRTIPISEGDAKFFVTGVVMDGATV